MSKPELSTRAVNMQLRRERILHEARRMLVQGGYDGINLRALAQAAELTVPTIYNLIGNKEELVVALFSLALGEIEIRMQTHAGTEPLEMPEAVVIESVGLFAEDEDYYRAALIAVEYLSQSREQHQPVARLYQWGERLATAGCIACTTAGYLRGRISAATLGQHILRNYRTNCRAWVFKRLSIEAFRDQALADVYITLAADAVETFHASLLKKISRHTASAPSSRTRKATR